MRSCRWGARSAGRDRRVRHLLLAACAVAAVAAWRPALDMRVPPRVPIDPARSFTSELLSVPGIGLQRARAFREATTAEALADLLNSSWARRAGPYLVERQESPPSP